MNNVIDIATRQPHIITDQHRRLADKIEALVLAEVPDATNIRVEHVEVTCPCMYRDLYGSHICDGCPQNRRPDGAA